MPKANTTTTTPPPDRMQPGAADTTRRQTLGYAGLAAAAALVATDAAAAVTARPDAELLAACAEYHRVHAAWDAPDIADDRCDELAGRRDELLQHVTALPARTAEGARAKAAVAHRALMWQVAAQAGVPWQEQAGREERLALDVLAGLAGVQS